MLIYCQKTGTVLRDGKLLARGYSGWDDGDGIPEPGEGKNDPTAQARKNIGPIPVGRYRIGAPQTHPTAGGYVMRLTPLYGTQTFGRDGFLIHGDFVDPAKRGSASHGCIILARKDRELLWATGERTIEVVANAPAPTQEIT